MKESGGRLLVSAGVNPSNAWPENVPSPPAGNCETSLFADRSSAGNSFPIIGKRIPGSDPGHHPGHNPAAARKHKVGTNKSHKATPTPAGRLRTPLPR